MMKILLLIPNGSSRLEGRHNYVIFSKEKKIERRLAVFQNLNNRNFVKTMEYVVNRIARKWIRKPPAIVEFSKIMTYSLVNSNKVTVEV
jgi:hypothetical protein